ncbi:hypothetical protein FA15DRAFT_243960 [Coprinopsis marcescibilis]|uniref:RNA-dependent RNA polymerase n=1 Tax=Coprinopsis marcescibilis TaxID=230819 RepID=A0A5C3KF48_COPMA|nr:hypothetical protein FA15DRAFT_243960 [Coprinopsis marcescibilis]
MKIYNVPDSDSDFESSESDADTGADSFDDAASTTSSLRDEGVDTASTSPSPIPSPPSSIAKAGSTNAEVESLTLCLSKLEISETLSQNRHPAGDSTSTIRAFLKLPLGRALCPNIIAHNQHAQSLLDDARVEWGVQWEIARGVVKELWTWDDVIAGIPKLKGSNADVACKVPQVLRDESIVGSTPLGVWSELDREEKATRECPERRLGLMGTWEGVPSWHGGQIQQIARLVRPDKASESKFKVVLEPMESRRSHRYARFLGSRRVIQIKINDKLVMEEKDAVIEFLSQKFVLMGRVFIPFHSKDGGTYMVETDEDFERKAQRWCADERRMSFVDFMEWHNPFLLNNNQVVSKLVTRYALGLSNSVPVLEFAPDSIFFIEDIYAPHPGLAKAPTEKIMTDGAGFMNNAALKAIRDHMGSSFPPTAVQGRIDGAKGLWVRHPTDDSTTPRIWIRASQNKIKNTLLDRPHRIFELVAPSHPTLGDSLTQQSILNIYHNGVSPEKLVKLFEQGLREEVAPLLDWDDPIKLLDAVNKAGGVSGARMARIANAASRALGLSRGEWRHDDVAATEDSGGDGAGELGPATYTGRNPYSGCPHSTYEAILDMLQAGFEPKTNKVLRDYLKRAAANTLNAAIEKYRIPLKESLWAFVIPDPFAVHPMKHPTGTVIADPLGILKEGEIFCRSSASLTDPITGLPFEVITGDVVIGRYPMRLPSDLQKVRAVNVPELSKWTDVIIASVRGERSLASLLSGGDMDGDTVHIFREAEIVENFQSKPFSSPPPDLMNNFEKDVETVTAFCTRLVGLSHREAAKAYQKVLLGNLRSSATGLYSMFHDHAVEKYGYSHPTTIRLAYIFNELLDSSKSGLRLREEVFNADKKEFGKKPEPFGVLADLKLAGAKFGAELEKQFQKAANFVDDKDPPKDKDLIAPYEKIATYCNNLESLKKVNPNLSPVHAMLVEELGRMRKHVWDSQEMFNTKAGESRAKRERSEQQGKKPVRGGSASKTDQDDIMLAPAMSYHQPIQDIHLLGNLEEIKASFAYSVAPTGKFAWSVAFTDLCLIKARKDPSGFAPVLRKFDERKVLSSAVVRGLNKTKENEVF